VLYQLSYTHHEPWPIRFRGLVVYLARSGGFVPGTLAVVHDLDLTAGPSRLASGDVGGHRLRRGGHVQAWVARVLVQSRPIWRQEPAIAAMLGPGRCLRGPVNRCMVAFHELLESWTTQDWLVTLTQWLVDSS
jgi:hypothetical protein